MKTYLGDSVYAEWDGYDIVLTTENGYEDDPQNRIVIEPRVYAELLRFVRFLELRLSEPESADASNLSHTDATTATN